MHLSPLEDALMQRSQALVDCELHSHVRNIFQQRGHQSLHTKLALSIPLVVSARAMHPSLDLH